MNKVSVNNGAAEKLIGDTENIVMTTSANTITAYSTYDKDNPTQNIISSPAQLSYSSIYGRGVTNFFEIGERGGTVEEPTSIDLSGYLTSSGTGVAPTIVIESTFKINYSHSGIITQFPERQQTDDSTNIGTYVTARSSLAYDPSDTTYSSNVSDEQRDTANRLYYRYEMTDADLKFNVYLPENTSDELTEADADSVTKANDQLGIIATQQISNTQHKI